MKDTNTNTNDGTNSVDLSAQSSQSALANPANSPQAHRKLAKEICQRGMTLIEIMVVIAVLGILAGVFMANYSGDKSKATRLLTNMKTLSDATNRAKMDMGGIPNRLSVLWNRTDATAGNMFNGIAATTSWSGPYMERQPVDASNNIQEQAISDATTITIAREAASATNGGNFTWVYYLRATNVPNAIITEYIKSCANTDVVANATFANGKCRATPGTGATEVGTVDFKIADSR
ncbi:prepilin-type N-terminal cleavage/methylation domain-containing protein [Limnohabitans radicicola]|uniref:Prepilin-type N-terminal cleavage/methylation domain-containing protein n=1 Tax=Limnohabitans radicicola TaxID=2771427 RepID=A0A927IMD7_9BURK|nr:prepilin-type N-terminal cleavage/methylation domain-containing protein [Limnohabitans radicicola]MBD8051081.1 prepilin-type N-terminal cleavage/methylation domain-containing protein [Limnohabitans radicicola]